MFQDPIAKVPSTNQVVRVLCHYFDLTASPRHDLNGTTFQHNHDLQWVHELQAQLPTIQDELAGVLPADFRRARIEDMLASVQTDRSSAPVVLGHIRAMSLNRMSRSQFMRLE
jgi:hypothetical protein